MTLGTLIGSGVGGLSSWRRRRVGERLVSVAFEFCHIEFVILSMTSDVVSMPK